MLFRHDDPPEGLYEDLARMKALERRRAALRTLAGVGALVAVPLASRAASCVVIESETAGPYPADGTNGNGHGTLDVLTEKGIMRSDIRPSFGEFTGVAAGVPLTLTLQLVDAAGGACANLADHAIYVWHCDQLGYYSLYTLPTENYLRGMQRTDAHGRATFLTAFPGCYPGRWPHIHFEVFRDRKHATDGTRSLKTSQVALLAGPCRKVYNGDFGYTGSADAFSRVSLANDSVFGDDLAAHEQPVMTGNAVDGYTATLTVGI